MGIKVVPKITTGSLSSNARVRERARRFQRLILRWAKRHGRSFPWRRTSDPFKTAVAEIMLQRTRSAQVVPVYREFIKRYPSELALANASVSDLERILRPLGLVFRAKVFLQLARVVAERHGGNFPDRAEDAIELPGVGPYVACAIDAFLTKRRIPVIDANVARVLGRVFGLHGGDWRYATVKERGKIHEIAWLCIGHADPRRYHYALLDFAGVVCTPRIPACSNCPVQRARICVFGRRYTD